MTTYDPYDQGAPAPYPSYPPPPPAHAPAKPKGGCLRMIGIAVVAMFALFVVGGIVAAVALSGSDDDDGDTSAGTETTDGEGPITNSGNTENPPTDDVTVTGCGGGVGNPAGGNFIGASGTIVNHSSEPSTYFISVEFVVGGTRYDESVATSSAVAPGQTVEWGAPAIAEARPGTECNITAVERFAA
jgi:hypothetical protein